MKSIALVEVWFGPFPKWYNLYLLSCGMNQTIDFFVFCDGKIPKHYPKNVHFVRLTEQELKEKVLAKFGVEFKRPNIGDLRPAMGSLFEDYLKDFDFWGYNDSDLIWGDIRHFITEDLLGNYDIITSCRASIVGQFTIFRNKSLTKYIHRIIPHFEQRICSGKPGYTEENLLNQMVEVFRYRVYRKQLQVHDEENSTEWMEWALKLELTEKGNLDDWFWEKGPCEWEGGHLCHSATRAEVMFFHFKNWKFWWRDHDLLPFKLVYWKRIHDGFIVTKDGIKMIYKPGWKVAGGFVEFVIKVCGRLKFLSKKMRGECTRIYRGIKRRL